MFFSRKEYQSEKNGMIVVEKFWGSTNIVVNGCLEAGTYLILMWKSALKKVPKSAVPKNALILGLGGGNIIRLLQKKYPDIKITVIEWDEVMIGIAKNLKLFTLTPNVRISNNDAREVVQTMSERFDLIFIDLFTGPIPPAFLGEDSFVENVKKLLKDRGHLFLNVYRHTEYISTFQKQFSTDEVWKFRLNTLALFRPLGHGKHDEKVPEGFRDIRQAENYLRGLFKNSEIIRQPHAIGVRQNLGPLSLEYYTGDKEPLSLPWHGVRLMIWDRVTSKEKPSGWHAMLPGLSLSTVVISDLKEDDYWRTWSETARRYRSQWHAQTEYEIVPIDFETFASHYMHHGRPKDTRTTILEALKHRGEVDKEHVRMFALRDKKNGTYWGGMAVVDAPSISHSYYLFAFLDKEHAPTQTGHWLINAWCAHCKQSGIRFANYGPVWTQGQQKSWKGFTEFKSHFRPFPLTYKPPLFKFTFSLKRPQQEKVDEQIDGIVPE